MGKSSLPEYLGSYPPFFEHYLRFWGTGKPDFAKPSLDELECNRLRVLKACEFACAQLKGSGFDLLNLEIVLFVGQHTTNGHAFLKDGKATAFIALESYHSDFYSTVFCAHEMLHALHYRSNPNAFFHSTDEKNSIARLLLTEGIATYLTKTIFGFSDNHVLWADYLEEHALVDWNKRFSEHQRELTAHCSNNFGSSSSKAYQELFELSDIRNPFASRAGYKIGLDLIESIVRKDGLSSIDVFQINTERLREELNL